MNIISCRRYGRQGNLSGDIMTTTAEFTAIIKKSGNSNCIFIPIQQMDIIGVKLGDVIKVTIEKK